MNGLCRTSGWLDAVIRFMGTAFEEVVTSIYEYCNASDCVIDVLDASVNALHISQCFASKRLREL